MMEFFSVFAYKSGQNLAYLLEERAYGLETVN